MATVKLVDFDHVTDYISREAAIRFFNDWVDDLDKQINDSVNYPHLRSDYKVCKTQLLDCIHAIKEMPAADVRQEAEISDAVYEAMYFLNSVSAKMPYHVYSALFDLILGILPTCGADMREPNLDTTKGEGRDESSG